MKPPGLITLGELVSHEDKQVRQKAYELLLMVEKLNDKVRPALSLRSSRTAS